MGTRVVRAGDGDYGGGEGERGAVEDLRASLADQQLVERAEGLPFACEGQDVDRRPLTVPVPDRQRDDRRVGRAESVVEQPEGIPMQLETVATVLSGDSGWTCPSSWPAVALSPARIASTIR